MRQLRVALTAFFALDGFVFAGWVVRIPDIKDQTGASPSALGVALLGVSAGAVVTMTLTGRLCQRFGNHPVTLAAGVLLAVSVALPPHTHSAAALGAVLLVFGTAFGAINVAANSAAVDLVAALGRPVMPSFHAAFSLGGMLGAGLGGLVAGQLSAARHLALLAGLGLVIAAVAGRALLAAGVPARPAAGAEPAAGTGAAGAMRGRVRWLVVVLGFVALCTTYGEGALADWSALHLRESLDASTGVAAAGYSVFALAMTVGRLTGSAMLQRLGQARALIAGGATAAAGMLLASLAPTVGLALTGFVITGLGLANVFPITIGQAGALAGPRGVAAASTLGYGGMLAGPVAIGFLAEWFSLATALTTVALLSAVAAVTAYGLRRTVQPGV
ncbi:MFS transporter [Streptomyces sp. DSM 44938]|uniref:MFS transporter n=1 Tax=Streptomyces litchfieldiae TaxID=3075543 RepID=A0ABU2N2B5_9ACTN|nr:MFS transporter [Streptomyces sp. DSM 44938]MDT0347198.1 MFS transporter [Streptomyces sp. DSM 44938]